MNGNEKGLSLIEVLVSLVILVVGLIGVFNLHIISKQGSFEAYQQTQASFLANDLINRMKLNRTQLANFEDTYEGNLSAPDPMCTGANQNCSDVEMLAVNKYRWDQLLKGTTEKDGDSAVGGLDDAKGCIQVDGNTVSVSISWRSVREVSTASGAHYSGAWTCGDENLTGNRRRLYTVSTMIFPAR